MFVYAALNESLGNCVVENAIGWPVSTTVELKRKAGKRLLPALVLATPPRPAQFFNRRSGASVFDGSAVNSLARSSHVFSSARPRSRAIGPQKNGKPVTRQISRPTKAVATSSRLE